MTDPWARPDDARPAVPAGGSVFEIPLSGEPLGDDPFIDAEPSDPPGRTRKVVGWSALAGVALGIVAAILIVTVGGGDDTPVTGANTVPIPDDPSQLTTPPTLPPIAEIDQTTATTERTVEPTPTAPVISFPAETIPPPATLPEFAPVAESDSHPGTFDLLAAAAQLDGSALHTVASVQAGADRFTISITDNLGDARDHVLADYDVETFGVDQIELVIDPAAGFGYQRGLPESPDQWELFTAEELLVGSGTDSLGVVAARLAAPLVTPATLASAVSIEDLGLVRLDRRAGGAVGEITRRYRIVFETAEVTGQSVIMQFVESFASDSPGTIEVDAYVTGEGQLALTTAALGEGFDSVAITLVVEAVSTPVPFALPPPELIIDEQ